MPESTDAVVSEPATIARRAFDVMMLCGDVVPSGLVASSYIHQSSQACHAAYTTHKIREKILEIRHGLSCSLLRLFKGKRSKGSCVIPKEQKFT